MKFFHLADIHIGKKLNQHDLLDDQKYILTEVLEACDREKPDAIILAGDLYDRRVPSVEAIELLDWFLIEMIHSKKIPVIAIGGNHDAGERLDFANELLKKSGLYIAGTLTLPLPQVVLEDAYGKIIFHLFPYASLAYIKYLQPAYEDMSYAEAMQAIVEDIFIDDGNRHVLVSHSVVCFSEQTLSFSDSERDISIGGTESWSHEALKAFDYVALGHLHRAQKAGAEHIRYAGSPLKYSFSEENHQKSITVVTLETPGSISIDFLPLYPKRDMRTIDGQLEDILNQAEDHSWRNDYLRVQLSDRGDVFEPMARLREKYPHILALERLNPIARTTSITRETTAKEESLNPLSESIMFYRELFGEEPSVEMENLMKDILNKAEECIL